MRRATPSFYEVKREDMAALGDRKAVKKGGLTAGGGRRGFFIEYMYKCF